MKKIESFLVSVIMPAYNSSATITESIESVLQQEYLNWELIIVDDGSQDDTVNIVKSYQQRYEKISLYMNADNRGAGFCRNKAIENAQGRFIAFLDADDIWCKDKLSIQVNFMIENKFELTYSYYQTFGKKKRIIKAPPQVTYSELLKSNVIGCLTAIYDTRRIGKKYMPLIRKRQDMGLWLDILTDVKYAYCCPKILAHYREGYGMTSNKLSVLAYQWRFYREVVGLSVFKSLYFYFFY
ncbi:glycosyltransferase family 2 protein, partial [Salinivibrio kushneri]|uniref:glycosyltransferase family 2 protein n=1 Tax=Salinivibrio kushneri TaxID=1908198 RepID=UPI001F51B955